MALNLTGYLAGGENDLAPWQVVLGRLEHLEGALRTTEALEPLRKYQLKSMARIKKRLGWEDKGTMEEKLLRAMVLEASCRCGDEDTLAKAKALLISWKTTGQKVSPNLRPVVYKFGVKQVSGF